MCNGTTNYLPPACFALFCFALFRLQHLMGAHTAVIIVIIAAIVPGTASAIVIIFSVFSPLAPASVYVQNIRRSIRLELEPPPLYISRSCTKVTTKHLYG